MFESVSLDKHKIGDEEVGEHGEERDDEIKREVGKPGRRIDSLQGKDRY